MVVSRVESVLKTCPVVENICAYADPTKAGPQPFPILLKLILFASAARRELTCYLLPYANFRTVDNINLRTSRYRACMQRFYLIFFLTYLFTYLLN
jgi:hypothetical protein